VSTQPSDGPVLPPRRPRGRQSSHLARQVLRDRRSRSAHVRQDIHRPERPLLPSLKGQRRRPRLRRRPPGPCRLRSLPLPQPPVPPPQPPQSPTPLAQAQPYDPALFARLRTWRAETAQQQGQKAFYVFSDATLKSIAAARPQTPEELRAIRGVGPKKLERYGRPCWTSPAAQEERQRETTSIRIPAAIMAIIVLFALVFSPLAPVVQAQEPDPYEPDDPGTGDAPWIADDEAQARSFYPQGDVDRARFRVKAGHWYDIHTRDLAPLVDTVLTVEVDGAVLEDDDGSPEPLASGLTFQAANTGEALITIVTSQEVYSTTQTYVLYAGETEAPPPPATDTPTPTPTTTPTPTATRPHNRPARPRPRLPLRRRSSASPPHPTAPRSRANASPCAGR